MVVLSIALVVPLAAVSDMSVRDRTDPVFWRSSAPACRSMR